MALSAAEGRDVSSVPKQQDVTKLIIATSIGNALEWYDIAVYGYFAIYVCRKPSSRMTIRRRRCC